MATASYYHKMKNSLMVDADDFMETMELVNPEEIFPITPPPKPSEQVSVFSQKDATSKLKMEEFSDLTALFTGAISNVEIIDSTDELNKSVYDNQAFDYMQATDGKPSDKVKVEYYLNDYMYNPSTTTTTFSFDDNHNEGKLNSRFNSVGDNQDLYLYKEITHLTDKDRTDEDSFVASNLSLNNNYTSGDSLPSSPADDQLSVPDHYDHPYNSKPKLSLMLEQFKYPLKTEPILNTPDVIDDVVSMGNDFNILDLVNNEDMTVLNVDEEFLSSLTSFPVTPPSDTSKKVLRKRKLSEEDEEYHPTRVSSDAESSDEDCPVVKKTKRGRPPKRGDSVSSEGSNVSKYRELRDKNNEASRRSRLKRKIKEQEYEKELDDLHTKNIRLKAQVEELEKMVNNFRDNLFKMMQTK